MMAVPLPASSEKQSPSLCAPSVSERTCSFRPKVLASESKSSNDVTESKGRK